MEYYGHMIQFYVLFCTNVVPNPSILGEVMAILFNIQDGGRRLVFAKSMISATLSTTGCHTYTSVQNLMRIRPSTA